MYMTAFCIWICCVNGCVKYVNVLCIWMCQVYGCDLQIDVLNIHISITICLVIYGLLCIYNPHPGLIKPARQHRRIIITKGHVLGPEKIFNPSQRAISPRLSKISRGTLIAFPLFVHSFKNDFLGHLRAGVHQEQTPINKFHRYFQNKFRRRGRQKIF